MKGIIFITSITILALFAIAACKVKKSDSQKVSTTVENTSVPANAGLVGKHWRLIELFGNPVVVSENSAREAHILFTKDNRYSGNAGCNRMSGAYQLNGHDRITFSQAVTTKMMCLDNMDTEDKFIRVINMADSYMIRNDTLILNKARMAPLARFMAVDMK